MVSSIRGPVGSVLARCEFERDVPLNSVSLLISVFSRASGFPGFGCGRGFGCGVVDEGEVVIVIVSTLFTVFSGLHWFRFLLLLFEGGVGVVCDFG